MLRFFEPYYPVSDLFRLVRDDDGLQLDFMATIHGVRSFEASGIARRGSTSGGIYSRRDAG